MVRSRGAIAVLAVILMVLSVIPIEISDNTDAETVKNDGIILYELEPKTVDGFAVMNYSSSNVDIDGYYVKNSSGKTYTFESYTLSPNNVKAIVKKTAAYDWFCENTATRSVTVDSSSIALKDSGDALYLYNQSGKLIDTVCYGNYQVTDGWSGIPVDTGYPNKAIRRVEPTDTNTYFDWTAVGDGYSAVSFADTKTISVDVTPFTFPECGGKQILQSLMGATESVRISIYMLTSGYVASILADLESKGVEVQIILENKPLGYDHDGELLKAMVDAGAEIKFIGGGTYDRYSYVHNKYAVIDGDEVIITSENWTVGNISKSDGNRGWGAIVYGSEFASEMNAFFENDWNFEKDFMSFSEKFPSASAKSLPTIGTVNSYIDSITYSPKTYSNVKASIYMSPDNTFKALNYLMSNATTRIYTEQMDVGESYQNFATTSPISTLISAANKGVDARFMVLKDDDVAEMVDSLNKTTNVKATTMGTSGYATMHNKGVIIDDAVWVSSVNWTDNAFMNNRECGLYLQSKELAQFYVDAYETDWNKNYKLTDTITVKPDMDEKSFTAVGNSGTCSWKAFDSNGNVLKESTGDKLTLDSLDDVSNIKVSDTSGNTGRYIISGSVEPSPEKKEEAQDTSNNYQYIGIGAVVLILLLIIVRKAIKK